LIIVCEGGMGLSENERKVAVNAKIELSKKKLFYFKARRLRAKKELLRIV
jgi:hypothetical protein